MRRFFQLLILVALGSVSPVLQTVQAQRSEPIVENVVVVGQRRLTTQDILSHIKTRPGEPFSYKQCNRDFLELVRLGVFDNEKLRVTMEDGTRGGVVVTFEVVEMPLVLEVKFNGLRGIKDADVIKIFRENGIHLEKDAVYDPVRVRAARRILLDLLESRGWPNANVTTREEIGGMYASVEFSVSYE